MTYHTHRSLESGTYRYQVSTKKNNNKRNDRQAVTIMTWYCINIPQVSHKNENKWSLITYLSEDSLWERKGWSSVRQIPLDLRRIWAFPFTPSDFLVSSPFCMLYRANIVIYRVCFYIFSCFDALLLSQHRHTFGV